MKITAIRTRVFEWKGKVVPPQAHFCTNATDILFERGDAMGSFRFHGWLVVEVETDTGLVGIGNCALAPRVAKEIIDLYDSPRDTGVQLQKFLTVLEQPQRFSHWLPSWV